MSQPVWQTPAGSLGKVPEAVYYDQQLRATTIDSAPVYYSVIAGRLPAGVQLTNIGRITGVPTTSIVNYEGVPLEVNRDVTSQFTIRAYTITTISGVQVIDGLADRTFSITITGPDAPHFTTPAGAVGTYYDGDEVDIQFQYVNTDPGTTPIVTLIAGTIPGGLILDPSGLLHGYIQPLIPNTTTAGYDRSPSDESPYDFIAESQSKNYQFTLEVADESGVDIRTFTMFVYSKQTMTADNTQVTADNTFITADVTTSRSPFLVNSEPSDLGKIRSDNYFAYKFIGQDYDTISIEYTISVNQGYDLPPGLTLDPTSGWLYGYIPSTAANTDTTYSFNITVSEVDNPTSASRAYPFTMTITNAIDSGIIWSSPAALGSIDNGSTSRFNVAASSIAGEPLLYELASGDFNQLPQGLELQPNGDIIGRVSFDTFALDGGTTTFDSSIDITRNINTVGTTFDSVFTFTVNAYAPAMRQTLYSVERILVDNGGSGYSTITPPTLEFSTPVGADSLQAEPGTISISGGVITDVGLSEPGYGYTVPATITITNQHGGANASFTAQMVANGFRDSISSTKTFSIRVVRAYNEPYQNLYIVAMPPFNDRLVLDELLTDTSIFVPDYIYRPTDPNFGVATRVSYFHAYGLAPATLETYVSSLYLNHYWKNLVLGNIETAQATDNEGNVIYEVVFSRIVDNLVNNDNVSVGKTVHLPYAIDNPDIPNAKISTVYPNSLVDMRDQVIDVVGQISTTLPLWMTSTQSNGRVLGYTPAWVLAYTKPNRSNQIAYYLSTKFGSQLNAIDFQVDRYVLDRALSVNWNASLQTWTPPPTITTFDREAHYELPNSNDSTAILSSGAGYNIGDQILILGSQVGGADGYNDIVITVATVDNTGAIEYAFCQGQAPITIVNTSIYDISGTNISGTGTGAAFDFNVVEGTATTFDTNSMQFTAPVDMYTASDQYDKYLVFPKANILV